MEKVIAISGTIIFDIIGSYILLKSQELGRDVSLKIWETMKSKESMRVLKKIKMEIFIE
jgi:hypothetical protein